MIQTFIIAALILMAAAFTACGVRGDNGATPLGSGNIAPILLFKGTGVSPGDVTAVESVLNSNHLNYSTLSSSQLNAMSQSQIREHRLLIVPGGNFIDIGNSLTPGTTTNIRDAVQSGLNYLGICAGGFFAGDSGFNGLNLTSGVRFHFYAAENQGIRKAAVAISGPGSPALDQYWEDGPQFTGWGAAVGKYPDGTPAVVEGTFGSGWVILSGVHPEAPASWRRGMTFHTSVDVDNAYASTLIDAALNRTSLSH
jgi:glutamine amidotransferase-like uncharacterized protein